MYLIDFSSRVSNFIDAADVNGNIKHNSLSLQYLSQIDNACKKAGINTGAVYPIIGSHADSHKFNFLNPRDTDDAFRLIYNNVNHSINGIKSNNTDGFCNTFFNPNIQLSPTNKSLFFYRSFVNEGGLYNVALGVSLGNTLNFRITPRINDSDGRSYYECGSGVVFSYSFNAKGFYMGISNGVSQSYLVNNTLQKQSLTENNLPDDYIYLLRENRINQTSALSSSSTYSFFGISDGISDLQAKVFSHDITVAQRSIGR